MADALVIKIGLPGGDSAALDSARRMRKSANSESKPGCNCPHCGEENHKCDESCGCNPDCEKCGGYKAEEMDDDMEAGAAQKIDNNSQGQAGSN
jgi:hypothetical protein